MIIHILRCSSKNEVHTEYNQIFERHMREIEAPNCLLRLFEAGIELALINGDTHSGEDWNENPEGSMTKIAISELLNDTSTIQNSIPTINEDWMGATVHGKDGEQMEIMLARQNILEIEHSRYIHGMGQSMLETPK